MIPSSVSVPIVWHQNSYKVRHTAVTVDTVISAFKEGKTPEQIADETAPLSVEDVYSVLAWYHAFQNSVDAYLTRKPVDEGPLVAHQPEWDYLHLP